MRRRISDVAKEIIHPDTALVQNGSRLMMITRDKEMKKKTGVYIHIPFCRSKCVYCDFLSAPPADGQQIKRYLSSLEEEIVKRTDKLPDDIRTADSVFFGGGTPSLLDPGELIFVLDLLKNRFIITDDAEITVECNPGMVGLTRCPEFAVEEKPKYSPGNEEGEKRKCPEQNKAEKTKHNPVIEERKYLGKLREAGVNRISFGLQSALDNELKVLGRIHRFQDFKDTFAAARAAGFKNINADIISAIPGQTIESFRETIEKVTELKPEHISCYSLILEEGTRLFEHIEEFPPLPDEDTEREMYHLTRECLKAEGYGQYEISNFARKDGKKDYRCRHNLGYWNRAVYFGFGAGAASFDGKVRYKNISDVEGYIAASQKEDKTQRETLTVNDAMAEFMFLGLRKTGGVSEADFFESFGKGLAEVYGDVLKAQMLKGTIVKTDKGYALTELGTDVSNVVLAEFIL